jgi:hypothetical protein
VKGRGRREKKGRIGGMKRSLSDHFRRVAFMYAAPLKRRIGCGAIQSGFPALILIRYQDGPKAAFADKTE